MDGISFAPLIKGEDQKNKRDHILYEYHWEEFSSNAYHLSQRLEQIATNTYIIMEFGIEMVFTILRATRTKGTTLFKFLIIGTKLKLFANNF